MDGIFSGEVTARRFIHFVWPSVLMMVIIGLYYNMDSVFVVNLVGEEALAGLSIAYPVQGIMWGFAVMLASGSSAIVAIKMGEGDQQGANEKYTLICIVSIITGIIFSIVCIISVSYTHLDVYKRQGMSRSDRLPGLCGAHRQRRV